jgi:uncharacterized protein DUF5680
VLGSHCLDHRDLEWRYRDDIDVGVTVVAGQGTISHRDVPVWAMVYAGGPLPNAAWPMLEVYAFLRRALLRVPDSPPYRGPAMFQERDFVSVNRWEGDPEHFRGVERIALAGQPIYQLHYTGGVLR